MNPAPQAGSPDRPTPPPLADRLLTWFVAPHRLESLQGDLHEEFAYQVGRVGLRRARWRYCWDVLGFVRPWAMKRKTDGYSNPNTTDMIRNYLTVTCRNLWRNPLYSLLSMGGLAIGLAVSLLMLLFVAHEHSYDQFHTKSDRIYRVWARFRFGDQTIQTPAMSARVGPVVKENLPGVEQVVRVANNHRPKIRSDYNHVFVESNFWLIDPSFFDVFDFKLIAGNRQTPIAQPMTVVLSENMAHKYFGTQDPIGQTLTYDGKLTFTVTGVMQNAPSNSSLQCDFATNIDNVCRVEQIRKQSMDDDDGCSLQFNGIGLGSFTTYFLVKDNQIAQQIPGKIRALIEASRTTGATGTGDAYFVQPLTDLHLGTNFGDTSNTRLINVFLLVGLLVLALALVNYMNLTTARATIRAKEVGVRKVSGASRTSIARQFYVESSVITLLGFGVSLLLVLLSKPAFLNLLDLQIDDTFWQHPFFIAGILALLILCVFVAGSYPALVISSFNPVAVMTGRFRFRSSGWIRRALTVFQFSASAALIICTIVIQQQVRFFRSKDVGLRKEQVVGIEFSSSLAPNIRVFERQIRQVTGVDTIAMSSSALYKDGSSTFFIQSPINKKEVSLEILNTNATFFDFFHVNWKIRNPDARRIGSPLTVILNETAAKQLGYTNQNLHTPLKIGGKEEYEVVGILKDFNNASLQYPVKPLAVFTSKILTPETAQFGGCLYLRLNPQTDVSLTLPQIGAAHQQFDPETPFSYYFLDQAFADQHKSEFRLASMFSSFMIVAILIACLGLFGLATFTAEQRTKEIGVRKVLGASVASITALLAGDFLKLVMIAIIIASPIAWYAMHQWLQGFAYRIDIDWWVFALAGLLAMLVAILTVSFQSVKAALMNPVNSLRSE